MLDGTNGIAEEGWKAEIAAARKFLGAMKAGMEAGKSRLSVILVYSPKSWGEVDACMAKKVTFDVAEKCGVNIVSHFTGDAKNLDQKLSTLKWPKGPASFMSMALMTAQAEITDKGRKDTKSVVVVVTGGRMLSARNTDSAAKAVRETTRLMWVPVTKRAPIRWIKRWATRRWQENVVQVSSWSELNTDETIKNIIADF